MGITIYNRREIKKIQEACEITANILDDIEELIEVGTTTCDINIRAEELVEKYGVRAAFKGYGGFPASVCISINDEVVHGIPVKDRILQHGDIVSLDFGVICDGYYGDSARTYPVGECSEKHNLLMKVTRDSLYKGIDAAKAGNRVSDISHAVEKHVKAFGFSAVRDYVGHGIGRQLHEEPQIPNFGKPGKGHRLQDGMVFAIEPMINEGVHEVRVLEDEWTVVTADGGFSAHFEHTVAIIDGKAEILTKGKNFK
jgi:methionyl aminopeptidase